MIILFLLLPLLVSLFPILNFTVDSTLYVKEVSRADQNLADLMAELTHTTKEIIELNSAIYELKKTCAAVISNPQLLSLTQLQISNMVLLQEKFLIELKILSSNPLVVSMISPRRQLPDTCGFSGILFWDSCKVVSTLHKNPPAGASAHLMPCNFPKSIYWHYRLANIQLPGA